MGLMKNIADAAIISIAIFAVGLLLAETGIMFNAKAFFSPLGFIVLVSLAFIEIIGLR